RRIFDAALVLCAANDMNVSGYVVRCVAGTQARPYAAVVAGLSAMQGARHSGNTERVEALFTEAATAEGARKALTGRLRRGETLPGFGSELYPKGDPRAAALLPILAHVFPDAAPMTLARALAREARELVGQHPTLGFALVALRRTLDLPDRAALALYA